MTPPTIHSGSDFSTRSATATLPPVSPREQSDYIPMNALARLIHRRKDELGLSWHEIGARMNTTHTVAYQLATKKTHRQPPRGDTLKRLARALEVDFDVVHGAALEAAGYDPTAETATTLEASEHLRVIADALSRMEPRDRLKLRRLAQAFVEDANGRGDLTVDPDEQARRLSEAAAKVSDEVQRARTRRTKKT